VSFTHGLSRAEINTDIKERLKTDDEALKTIFAWVVQGYYDCKDFGLHPPASVNAATKQYQLRMNPLAEFVASECIDDINEKTPTAALYERFKFSADLGALRDVRSIKSFGIFFKQLAEAVGYRKGHGVDGNYWEGVRLRDINDDIDDSEGKNSEQLNSIWHNTTTRIGDISEYRGLLQITPSTLQMFNAEEERRAIDEGTQVLEKETRRQLPNEKRCDQTECNKAAIEEIQKTLSELTLRSLIIEKTIKAEAATTDSRSIHPDALKLAVCGELHDEHLGRWRLQYLLEFYQQLATDDVAVQALIASCLEGNAC
jgi:hypothetical protein